MSYFCFIKVNKPLDEYLVERKARQDAYPYMREERTADISDDIARYEIFLFRAIIDCSNIKNFSFMYSVDMESVSVVASSIIEALEKAEDEDDLDLLSRHEIIVTSPGGTSQRVRLLVSMCVFIHSLIALKF